MMMETMPDVLSWNSGGDVLAKVYKSYVELLSDLLASLLKRLDAVNDVHAAVLKNYLDHAPDETFMRVLTAPEVSYRLIWTGAGTDCKAAEFIVRAFQAEQTPGVEPGDLRDDVWTALGDRMIQAKGGVIAFPQLEDFIPLDFGSPLARSVDLGGPGGEPWGERPEFTAEEISLILNRLREAAEGIRATQSGLHAFVVLFNKVLISQKDPGDPFSFTSGSTGQYVGRSFLTNPHLQNVTASEFAEALVHEGIHALLYMNERRRAWVINDDLYAPIPRIVSPWSGNKLALRPYLQACFVWYGLLHFWCQALMAGSFRAQSARARLAICLKGFRGPSLLVPLQPYVYGISPELLQAIAQMQERVCLTLEEATAA